MRGERRYICTKEVSCRPASLHRSTMHLHRDDSTGFRCWVRTKSTWIAVESWAVPRIAVAGSREFVLRMKYRGSRAQR
jgi:hypothetical protein